VIKLSFCVAFIALALPCHAVSLSNELTEVGSNPATWSPTALNISNFSEPKPFDPFSAIARASSLPESLTPSSSDSISSPVMGATLPPRTLSSVVQRTSTPANKNLLNKASSFGSKKSIKNNISRAASLNKSLTKPSPIRSLSK